jgi:hypothetical protein
MDNPGRIRLAKLSLYPQFIVGGSMRALAYFAIVLVALSLTPAIGTETTVELAKQDESLPKGDPDMEAASRRARETLQTLLDLARSPRPTIISMAVKVAVQDGGDTEYFLD